MKTFPLQRICPAILIAFATNQGLNSSNARRLFSRQNSSRPLILFPALLTLLSIAYLLLPLPAVAQTQPDPCPPKFTAIDGFPANTEDTCESNADLIPASSDTEYGATQIVGGACPRVPSSFPAVYQVRTESEFNDAYARVQPGEAIVLMDGAYNWNTDVTLNKNGTASDPIYIIYENLHGFVCTNCARQHFVTGDYHVFAGFKFVSHDTENFIFHSGANGNRVACMYFNDGADSDIKVSTPKISNPGVTDLEVDNNVFDDHDAIPIDINDCAENESWCTDSHNAHDFHIHHNTFKNKQYAGNGNEAIMLGLAADMWAEGTYTRFGNDRLDAIIENNLFDGWNGDPEIISVKGSRNIIRFNCVREAPSATFVVRSGNDNLIYGNWLDSVSSGIRISGARNHILFNYIRIANGEGSGVIHHPEVELPNTSNNQLKYFVSKDGAYTNNVITGAMYMVYTLHQIPEDGIINEVANGNLFQGNDFYSDSLVGNNNSNSYKAGGNIQSEAEFRAANTWGTNSVFGSDLASTTCGNPSHFNGPGTSATVPSTVLGGGQTITAPSWW